MPKALDIGVLSYLLSNAFPTAADGEAEAEFGSLTQVLSPGEEWRQDLHPHLLGPAAPPYPPSWLTLSPLDTALSFTDRCLSVFLSLRRESIPFIRFSKGPRYE